MYKRLLPALIPVPKDYRRVFGFTDSESGFVINITVTHDGVEITQAGDAGPKTASLCLDWIAESIMMVREELGV